MKPKFQKLALSLVLIAMVSTMFSMATGAPALLIAGGLFAIGFIKGIVAPKFQLPTNMAYDLVISDTAYAGEAAAQMIVPTLIANETFQGGHIYLQDGIKKKYTIPRFDADYEDLIQDRAAVPTSKGDLNIDGKTLEPADYMIYIEFNTRDFEQHWYAVQTGNALLEAHLPMTAEAVIINEVLKRHGKYVNKAIWNSDTTLAEPSIYRYYDGLLKKAADSTDTIDATSATTLSASNIFDELAEVYGLIPDVLKYDPAMKIFMNYKTYGFYEAAQFAQTNKGVDVTRAGIDTYRGLKVVKIQNIPDNCMFAAKGLATPESNLWMGINSMDDENKIQLGKLQANAELYFIKMLVKADVQIGWNEETVYYQG